MDALDETESHRSEQRTEAPDEAPVRTLARRTSPEDNRSLFIDAMGDPIQRRIAFDIVERNCRMRFRVGDEGIRVYLQLLTYVQSSKVDESVGEFERRFLPMLDQKVLKRMIEEGRMTPT
jgi:hypothetical protein